MSGVRVSKLHVPAQGCSTCPYRRDTEPGIWAPEEYEKLRAFDRELSEDLDALRTFNCHQSKVTGKPTVCRGWLSVHQNGVGVRLAVMNGSIDPEDVPLEPEDLYYATGNEAAEAGLAGVPEPSDKATGHMDRLMARGSFRLRDEDE